MKQKRRIITVLAVVTVIAGIVVFEYIRSTMFHITVESITPNPVSADGRTAVSITLRLTDHKGDPVEGHNLFALPQNGGAMRANRVTTDQDGYACYTYFPYKLTTLIKLEDVVVDVIDESNSIFVEINTRTSFVIGLTEPQEDEKVDIDFDSIFGE